MTESAVTATDYAPGARLTIPRGQQVEFCPWLRTEAVETQVLVTDLVHSLGRDVGPVNEKWRRRLEAWANKERIVYQFAADGKPVARYAKRLRDGEIWRLSFGRAESPSRDYGLLVFTGVHVLCHFQIIGPGIFATCHSRRSAQFEPACDHPRSVPVPNQPGHRLSLFLMNRGEGSNRIILSRPLGNGTAEAAAVTLAPLGCRLVCLHRLFKGLGQRGTYERVFLNSVYPCDYYTLVQNGDRNGSFSIQHIK